MRPQELSIERWFERAHDAMVVAEARSGRVLSWSPAAEKMFGYSSSEALGMRVEDLIPEFLNDKLRAGTTCPGNSGTLLEMPVMRKDGQDIWVEMSLSPLDSPNDLEERERCVLAVMRDVTGRKEAEEAIRESEGRMRCLADAAFEGILITEDGRIVDANRAFFECLGYGPADVIGRSALEFVAPEYRELVQRNMLSGYEGPYEIVSINAAGERIDVEVRGKAFLYKGRPARVTTIQDIRERKKAQQIQEHLAAIVESSDDAIVGRDLDGLVTSWNSGAQRIYGYTKEEAMGKPVSILVPPERTDETRQILEKVKRGESIEDYDTVRITKDGSRLYVSITVSPVRNASGEIIGISTIARDITERIEREQEIKRLNETLEKNVAERTERLVESEQRLKELVGKVVAAQEKERQRVAYDIHDGLTQAAIATHQTLQVFAQTHPPGSTVEEGDLDRALALAQKVVREARHVIEDLRPTSLDDFGLTAALRLEIEELQEEGWEISLEEDLGEERLAPETETALFRMAMEALTNVRKHSRTNRAAVKLSREPETVRLEVTDRGQGFDPCASSARDLGEQVGLAGMRERVGLLDGRLQIKSRPGKGTTVTAMIPLSDSSGGESYTGG